MPCGAAKIQGAGMRRKVTRMAGRRLIPGPDPRDFSLPGLRIIADQNRDACSQAVAARRNSP